MASPTRVKWAAGQKNGKSQVVDHLGKNDCFFFLPLNFTCWCGSERVSVGNLHLNNFTAHGFHRPTLAPCWPRKCPQFGLEIYNYFIALFWYLTFSPVMNQQAPPDGNTTTGPKAIAIISIVFAMAIMFYSLIPRYQYSSTPTPIFSIKWTNTVAENTLKIDTYTP